MKNQATLQEVLQELKQVINIFTVGHEKIYELSASGSKFIITSPKFGMFSGIMLSEIYKVADKHYLSMVVVDNRVEILYV